MRRFQARSQPEHLQSAPREQHTQKSPSRRCSRPSAARMPPRGESSRKVHIGRTRGEAEAADSMPVRECEGRVYARPCARAPKAECSQAGDRGDDGVPCRPRVVASLRTLCQCHLALEYLLARGIPLGAEWRAWIQLVRIPTGYEQIGEVRRVQNLAGVQCGEA